MLSVDISGLSGVETAIRTATGPGGLALIAVYSFLIAFVLPLPSEVVLVPVFTKTLRLGLPMPAELAIVMVVSSVGKAAGSVLANDLGYRATHSGPMTRLLARYGIDVVEWSKRQIVAIVKQYGYIGLAAALSIPGVPDTLSIYAFSVLDRDYRKFAAATFAGSVGRLVITVIAIHGFNITVS